jgi:hypothetical protein
MVRRRAPWLERRVVEGEALAGLGQASMSAVIRRLQEAAIEQAEIEVKPCPGLRRGETVRAALPIAEPRAVVAAL